MITTVANSLFDRLVEAFPPNRPYGRKDIHRDPMPEPLAAYLDQELDVKLEELLGMPGDAWVDVDAPEIKAARARYVDALEQHQAVPAGEWAAVLRSACHQTLRYLVRPAATLSDAVFSSGVSSVRSDDVLRRMDFYSGYPYVRSVIEAYFEQKDATRIDRERFEALVRRTDRQMTSDFSARQWRRLLEPLVGVLSAAGIRKIPLELLKELLQEKAAEGPLRRMKQRYGLDGFIPLDELETLFVEEEVTAPPTRRTRESRRDERPTEHTDASMPLWKQFEPGYGSERTDAEPPHADRRNGSSEPLWKQFRTTSESGPRDGAAAFADLERSVLGERGARNRDLFVKHLFSGRREDYETTLRQLARADSWSQASQIIAQEVFLKHQVNIYSDPAVAFTDAAEAQYRS